MTRSPLMTIGEVAEYLRVSTQTLYNWRSTGTGPTSYKVGRELRYETDAVHAWLRDQAEDRVGFQPPKLDDLLVVLKAAQEVGWGIDQLVWGVERLESCPHAFWAETGTTLCTGDGNVQEACGLPPKLLGLLGGEIHEVQPCGHTLDTPEMVADVETHLRAGLVGEGTIWTCEMEAAGFEEDFYDQGDGPTKD